MNANLTNSQAVKAKTWTAKIYQLYVAALVMLYASTASAGLTGGLSTAKSSVSEITTSVYALVGVAAGAYLLWQAVLCWNGKKDWSDMVPALVHVAVAGGSITAAAWAWGALS